MTREYWRFILFLLPVFWLMLILSACDNNDESPEIFEEGVPIHGTEVDFPLGFYDAEDHRPILSPDGNSLLYSGPSGSGLWVLNLATGIKTRLHEKGRNGAWAPDNQWIAFNIGPEIFRMKSDGADLTQLTTQKVVFVNSVSYTGSSFMPAWSPDGTKIAYYFSIDHRTGIQGTWIMSPQGDDLGRKFEASDPAWAPTGTRIIGLLGIASNSSETKFPVFDLDQNLLIATLSAVAQENNQRPQFSPDGSRILFCNAQGIYLMNADGSSVKKIIPSHLYNGKYSGRLKLYASHPSWSPDGNYVIYEHLSISNYETRYRGDTYVQGTYSIYKVNADSALQKSELK